MTRAEAPSPEDPRRALPSVDRLSRAALALEPALPGWAVRLAARERLEAARAGLAAPESGAGPAGRADLTALAAQVAGDAARLAQPTPRRVVNATGVVLHTNLGRAPLAPGAAAALAELAAGYSDLELDLASGARGDRQAAVAAQLRALSGAAGALAVNNGAAALLLAVNTLAPGREVVVSRGELVEIGGSFRVPEILHRAGVRLREVGTTNRTHLRDYAAAIGPETGALLKVHRSNFEQRGFVSEVGLPELAALGLARGLPVIEDLGSATLVDLRSQGLPPESFAPARLVEGLSLLCFSGDKLLGGPQAGIVLGAAEPVARLRANPLARALRLDKLSLAALDWTLRALLEGRSGEIPVLRLLLVPADDVERRARALAELLEKHAPPGLGLSVVATRAPVGGGSLPGFALASFAVALSGAGGADRWAAALRAAPVPVVGRVEDGRLLLDARTLLPGDESDVEAALRHAARQAG